MLRNKKSGLMKNKRGIYSLIMFPIAIFALAVTIFGVFTVYNAVKDTDLFQHDDATREVQQDLQRTVNIYNWTFMAFVVASIIALALTAYKVQIPLPYAILGLIILIIMTFVTAPMYNAFEEFSTDPNMQPAYDQYGLINWAMSKITLILTIGGAIYLVTLYAKKDSTYT